METNDKSVILLSENELESLRGGLTGNDLVESEDLSTAEGNGFISCCNGNKVPTQKQQ